MQIGQEALMIEKALVVVHSIWVPDYCLGSARNKVQLHYLQLKQTMWLLHLAAHNSFVLCKHCKTFRSHVIHPFPFYVIIQAPSVFQKIQSCIPRPSTYPSNIIFYMKKCLNKRSNWSMFPPKNRLLIYSPNHCPEKHLSISDRSWEYLMHHLAIKSSLFQRKVVIREFHEA